jgi:transmembrane sensor
MRKTLHPISQLIIKHLEGTANTQEKKELEVWINADAANLALFEELSDEYRMSKDLAAYSEDKKATWAKIVAMAPELEEAPVRRIPWLRYSVAAAILLIAGIGAWYLYSGNNKNNGELAQTNKGPYKNDVAAPASDRATLTLADGKVINLDAVQKGQLAEQGKMDVVKKEDGTIEYRESSIVNRESGVAYNTISTNRGSRYKVVLADNSIVWLNSASSLKYPTAFTGESRTVELTGEGYFEVAKSPGAGGKKRPFMVKVNGMQVEVLGTHFNIMSYTDESAIKTTLLEGSVRVTPVPVAGVRNSQLLSPGQQAILAGGQSNASLKVQEADTEEAIAWKNEIFVYNNASIETIMREVARSYDVEVVYEGERPTDKFNVMGVPRNVPVSQILKILELTDKIRFDIEGRRITVRKG